MSRMQGQIRSPENGFTLLELLLTLILLGAGLASLLSAISLILASGGINESEVVATHLAEEKMETLKNTSYSGIANETKAVVSGFTSFQREVAVTTPVTSLEQITVTVYWNHKSAELSKNLVTYRSDI